MATKTIWATLAATTLWLTGCATLSGIDQNTQSQRESNQPQMSELDTEAANSATASSEASAASDETIAKKEPAQTSQPAPSSKPQQDPGVDAVQAQSEPAEPPPSPEQVVIRLQQLALQLQSEGKWQEAETVLQRALRIDVQKVDIYHQLATVRMGQQRFTEAEQIAMKGLTYTDKSPKFKASLWEVIAQCRSAQGDIDGANEAREEMLKWMSP
ncbi:hypothetical protein KO489_07670 [Reinekea forsetii]|nr:hypothetical protein [Reinekea forsetii]